ncbi:hypothetical protein JNUCC64_09505 [Streptomyces sp. JNUCC 64]
MTADQPAPRQTVGAPENAVRKGVPSSCRPDPRPARGARQVIGGLRITARGRGATPTARSWCVCGRDRFAAGEQRVLALITDHHDHTAACPRHAGEAGAAA